MSKNMCGHDEHENNIPCLYNQRDMLLTLAKNLIECIETDPIELTRQIKLGKLIIKRVEGIK